MRTYLLCAVFLAVGCSAARPQTVRVDPSASVVAWLAHTAIALDHVEAGRGLDDMGPVASMIGAARIVGLGEATHGTREFFQLKHRFVELAVTRLGFTVFGIEAGQPECRAINEYVATGRGDPRATLRFTPIWDTEEVVALIEWMRAWNADPTHARKLKFVGFDMQTPIFAYRNVVAFLTRVAPEEVSALTSPVAVLEKNVGGLTAPQWGELVASLGRIGAAFDRHQVAWTRIAGANAFADARHDVTVMEQAARSYQLSAAEDDGAEDARDRAMADNVAWTLAQEPPGTRMLLWAHNGHVQLQRPDGVSMGSSLRELFGPDYVSVGFLFGQGAYRTVELRDGRAILVEQAIGPGSNDDVSAPFVATRRPVLAADLRKLPRGAVADWFAAPHALREAGGTFASEEDMTERVVLPARFDLVVFVARMTASRPASR